MCNLEMRTYAANYSPPQDRLAQSLHWLSLGAFFATLVLIPVRFHFLTIARPNLPIYSDYTDFLLYLPDIAMLLTLIFWGLNLILSPRLLTFGPRHIWIPLTGLTVAGGLSILTSFDRPLSTYYLIRWIGLFAFYVFIVNEIRSVRLVVIPIALQVAIQSPVALAQFIAQHSVGLESLGELQLDPAQAGISIISANGVRLLRAYGLSDHPNIVGGCFAFALLLLFGVYLHKPTSTLTLAALLPGLAALLVTFSRSAWLAFLAGAACLLGIEILSGQRHWIRPMLILASIGFFLLAPFILAYPAFFRVRLNAGNPLDSNPIEQQSIDERILLFRSAIPLFKDHPLIGVGLGAGPIALKAYYPTFPIAYQPPHFTLFDAALETGLIGGIFYFLLFTLPLFTFLRMHGPLGTDPVATTSVVILLSILIVGFFDYYPWLLEAGRMWQWLAWGLWGAALSRNSANRAQALHPGF